MEGKTRRDFLKAVGLGTVSLALPGCVRVPGKSTRKRPNILLLFPDQLRHDWIEPNPVLPLRTPNVEKLAAEGVRFTKAVTPSPQCAPARACLAAGKEYDNCGVPSNDVNYPLYQLTFYRLLRDAGYHVMGCGKFDLHKQELHWGLDGKRLIHVWGFSDGVDNGGKGDGVRGYREAGELTGPYMAYLEWQNLLEAHLADFEKRTGGEQTFPTPLPDEAYCDNWIARNGLDLIRSAPETGPWFLQVNFNGPHPPWDITKCMEKPWRGVDFPQPNGGKQLTPDQYNAVRQNYAAMIENIDCWLGRFVEELRQRSEIDDTLIVFSSDHGEMLGDHDEWSKKLPYQPSVGVPLMCWGPGVRKGVVCEAPTTTMDLTATFLDYAGVPALDNMDSRSLRPYLEGKVENHRDYVLSGHGPWRMVFDGRYKYIEGFGEKQLLFDLANDPLENENIAADEPERVKALQAKLPTRHQEITAGAARKS